MADLVLLPGLGADGRLFDQQAAVLSGRLRVPPWPALRSGDSLSTFAQRLVDAFAVPSTAVVGGASFGGMVALELAAIVRPRAVVLLGSCTSPESIAPALRIMGRLCASLPESWFSARPWTAPVQLPKLGHLSPAQRRLFWEMATAVAPAFFRWGCQAMLSWRPTAHDVPVFHLHGSADRVIPVRRVRPTEIVPGAGHLLSLSHPTETSDFLSRILARVG